MNRQKIFIGVLLVAALVGGYMWFGDSLSPGSAQGESQIAAEYAPVLSQVAHLKTITIDTEVIRGEKFKRLLVPAIPPLPDVKPGVRIPYLPL